MRGRERETEKEHPPAGSLPQIPITFPSGVGQK